MTDSTHDCAPVGRGARGLAYQAGEQAYRPAYRTARRRRPPYGARLAAALARPETWPGRPGTSADRRHVSIWVLAGPDAWDTARDYETARAMYVIAPPGDDVNQFDWSLLAGHPPVLLLPCGELPHTDIAALVSAMVRDGVERVLVMSDQPRLFRAGMAS